MSALRWTIAMRGTLRLSTVTAKLERGKKAAEALMVCDVREQLAWPAGIAWAAPAVASHTPMPPTAAARPIPLLSMGPPSSVGVVADKPRVIRPPSGGPMIHITAISGSAVARGGRGARLLRGTAAR